MIENSTRGLTLLDAAHTVVVTGVGQYQGVLAPWAPGPDGRPRLVAVELFPATVDRGGHVGRRGIEVRIDGRRAGELTPAMAQRYLPDVDDTLRDGGRPACVALVAYGPHELEMELRLPDVSDDATAVMSVVRPGPPPPQRRLSRTPYLVGAAVLALLLGVGVAIGGVDRGDDARRPAAAAGPSPSPTPTPSALAVPVPVPLALPAATEIAVTTARRTAERTPEPAAGVPNPPTAPAPPPRTDPPAAAAAATVPPTTAPTTTARPELLAAPTTGPVRLYRNCRQARADGVSDVPQTDPRYDPDLDDNEDGVACGPGD